MVGRTGDRGPSSPESEQEQALEHWVGCDSIWGHPRSTVGLNRGRLRVGGGWPMSPTRWPSRPCSRTPHAPRSFLHRWGSRRVRFWGVGGFTVGFGCFPVGTYRGSHPGVWWVPVRVASPADGTRGRRLQGFALATPEGGPDLLSLPPSCPQLTSGLSPAPVGDITQEHAAGGRAPSSLGTSGDRQVPPGRASGLRASDSFSATSACHPAWTPGLVPGGPGVPARCSARPGVTLAAALCQVRVRIPRHS